MALAGGIANYLCGVGDTQLNYLAGQAVVLRLSPEERVSSYVLQMPDGSAVRQSLTPGQQDLSIAATESLGNYRVRAGGQDGQLDRGFSINLPAEVTQLARVPAAEIVDSLGKQRTRVARTQQEIELRVGLGRVGRELFPALIIAVALVLAAEQLLANRFYGRGVSAIGSQLSASSTPRPSDSPTADGRRPTAQSRRPTATASAAS